MQRKWAAAIGVLACLGAAVWMRELGLARPKLIGNKIFNAREMRVSRDGRWLWTLDSEGMTETFALDPATPRPAMLPYGITYSPNGGKAFHAAHGMDTFPRYWFDRRKDASYFVRREGEKPVTLRTLILDNGGAPGWSLERGEIYSADFGVISIWNMNNGRLKKQIRFGREENEAESVFSPDGKWLLSLQTEGETQTSRLRRYEVQSGKLMPAPDISGFSAGGRIIQFSPDGKYLLAGGSSDWEGDGERITMLDATHWKPLWSAILAFSARFSPDARVGIVKADGFEWRDVRTGKLLRTQDNPAKGTGMWTISPDGKWIYAENSKRQIVRWRAR